MTEAYKIRIYKLSIEDVCVVNSEKEARDRAYLIMKRGMFDEQDGLKIEVEKTEECEDCGNEVGSENLEVSGDMLVCPDCKDNREEQFDGDR